MKSALLFPRMGVLILLVCSIALHAVPQSGTAVHGPVLGFIPDARVASIRPILGIPGASILGLPIALDTGVRLAAVSPTNDEALAILSGSPDVVSMIRFSTANFERLDLPQVNPGADLIVFSPSGTAAALYDYDSSLLQALLLNPAPEVLFRFDTSRINGRLTAAALSDSGRFAALRFTAAGSSQTWLIHAQGASALVPVRLASALAFVPGTDEFLVADADSGILSRVSQLDAMASQGLQVLPVFSAAELQGLVAMTLTPDALRLAAITVDGVALVADLATGSTLSLPCYCKPSGIQALRGRPVFRLSNPEDGAIAVLDARAPSARVVVIPPEVTP